MSSAWLRKYYTEEEMKKFAPTVLFDGRTKAVIMLRALRNGAQQVGYILVSKNGKHNVSTHEALHEGFASTTDIGKMRRRLTEVDGA